MIFMILIIGQLSSNFSDFLIDNVFFGLFRFCSDPS